MEDDVINITISNPFIKTPITSKNLKLNKYTIICDKEMSSKSEYQVLTKVDDCVFLIDLHGDKSVTNDAERVTKELFEKYGNARFIYKDSLGVWDELMHDYGEFSHFSIYTGFNPFCRGHLK